MSNGRRRTLHALAEGTDHPVRPQHSHLGVIVARFARISSVCALGVRRGASGLQYQSDLLYLRSREPRRFQHHAITRLPGGAPVTTNGTLGRIIYLVPVIGALLAYGLWAYTSNANRQLAHSNFLADTGYELTSIRLYLSRIIDVIDDLARFESELKPPGVRLATPEFDRLAKHVLEREPALQALSWNSVVPHADRDAFETQVRADLADFRITERDASGQLVRATAREQYVVVQSIHPHERNAAAVGFDVASDPRRQAAIEQADRNGRPAATAPITLVQESGDQRGLLVFAPSRRTDSDDVIGYVVAVIRMDEAIDAALANNPGDDCGITVTDLDVTDADAELMRYSPPEPTDAIPPRLETFEFAGRRWQLEFTPGSTYAPSVTGPLLLVATIALLTALSIAWVGNLRRHATRLAREVEQRTAAQVAQRDSEAQLRMTVESIFTGGWDWNFNTGRMVLSESYREALGYAPGELPHSISVVDELIHPDDRAVVREALRKHLHTPDSILETEFRARHKDGTYRLYQTRGKVVSRNPDGTVARLLGFSTDVTDERNAAALRARLEAKVQDAQKLESLGMLAGGIAHDFNNLLVGVLSTADMALARCEDPTLQDLLMLIVQSAQRASELTNEMLTYAGRSEITLAPVDASDVVLEMQALLESSIHRRHALALSCEPDLVIDGDATQLRQVVLNLVTNAADAMGEQSGTISVQLQRHTPAVGEQDEAELAGLPCMRLRVVDDGCGMDVVTQRRALDPFFSTKERGRGLGLASVAGIVRRHRGTLQIASRHGSGTTVTVLLPLTDALPATDASADHRHSGEPKSSKTVLIVDDEPTVRDVASRLLELEGHTVLTADSGTAALAELDTQTGIELVLVDASMPGMTGLETFAEIRRRGYATPVVLMSGYVGEQLDDNEAFNELAGFVQKPFTSQALTTALSTALT